MKTQNTLIIQLILHVNQLFIIIEMSKIFLSLALVSILVFSVYTQDDSEAAQEGIPQQSEQQLMMRQQQQLSMKRTACLVLSRYHSNSQKEHIEPIISELQPEDQQKYINKMYATAIEHCLPKISVDQAQKFFVEDPNFSADQLFYLLQGFDYSKVDFSTFTKNQQNLVKFMKNFDEQMQVRKEQKEAEQKQRDEDGDSFDMKFFGFSKSDFTSGVGYVYFLIFIAAVSGAIYYLMSKIDSGSKKNQKKKKRSPAKTNASPSSKSK